MAAAAAKIRAIKELATAAPLKTQINLDAIITIMRGLKDATKVYEDDKGYYRSTRISKTLYNQTAGETRRVLSTMGIVVLERENWAETDYYYQASVTCDARGVMSVDTSVLDALEE